jgi:hypothetical protein
MFRQAGQLRDAQYPARDLRDSVTTTSYDLDDQSVGSLIAAGWLFGQSPKQGVGLAVRPVGPGRAHRLHPADLEAADNPVEGGDSTVAKKGIVHLPETVVGSETIAALPAQIFRRLFEGE